MNEAEAMRDLARVWRARAAELAALAQATAVDGIEGPAGTRLDEHASALRRDALHAAEDLEMLADELVLHAQRLEDEAVLA